MKAKSNALKKKVVEHEGRSEAQPATASDKKLGQKHLVDSIKFNERHAKDHKKLLEHDEHEIKKVKSKALKKKLKESEDYNEDHLKRHEENAEEDREEMKKRKEK